jgi:hypothetical protein
MPELIIHIAGMIVFTACSLTTARGITPVKRKLQAQQPEKTCTASSLTLPRRTEEV